jgi:secondary thiamine-phosphate synthase enzyme
MLKEIQISTHKSQEIIDITQQVAKIVNDSGIKDGICLVYTPHATAGILINENYDKGVCDDIINQLEKLVPTKANYKHDCVDNNAHAHIKASLIGPNETIIIKDGELALGTWQGLALAEFDGPRKRKVLIKILKG